MSVVKNILAGYASQVYTVLIGIVMMPVFIRYMGTETYGLVGFFTMLQAWFQLLDVGLTPTMARETARFRGGAVDANTLRRLLRSLEGIFFGIAVIGCCLMIAFSPKIASTWLKVQELPLEEVSQAIMIMALIIALRWVCGLYRGAISGFEHFVWLSGFNIFFSTVRFVAIIPFFIYIGTSATHFFCYQLAVALIETALLIIQTYRLMPKVSSASSMAWEWRPLRNLLSFSLGIAFTNSIGILVTQTDKLLLSTLLPLKEYGSFTLVVLIANGVTMISSPIFLAMQPRLTKLSAEEDNAELILLYRRATQLVGLISVPAATILAFFPQQVLWAWTGDNAMSASAAPILALYAAGNGLFAMAAFPYYLQFAKGDIRLHVIGNALFVLLLIPSLIWATSRYGILGAGYSWLFSNIAYFLFWVPKVHHKFVKGLHTQWLARDIGGIAMLTFLCVATARWLVVWPQERMQVAIGVGLLSLTSLVVVASASPYAREILSRRLKM